VGELDAHAAEALRLQIRRLARQHGIDLVEMRVEPDADEQPSA
jgi:type IV pilus biogenesis protein CpaD/CtpE